MKKRFLTKNLYKDYSHKGGKSYGIAGFGAGGKCTFWKRKNEKRRKNERSVSLVRFFRALKCVKFCFCIVKYKVIGTIAAVLQMYTFLGGGVHL